MKIVYVRRKKYQADYFFHSVSTAMLKGNSG